MNCLFLGTYMTISLDNKRLLLGMAISLLLHFLARSFFSVMMELEFSKEKH